MADCMIVSRRSAALTWLVGACASALCLSVACRNRSTTAGWPSFPPEVIEAGRGLAVPGRAGVASWSRGSVGNLDIPRPTPTPAPVARILATKESVLGAIRISIYSQSSQERGAGHESVRALDLDALEPLLAILQEDAMPCEYAHSIMTLLIRLGREDRMGRSVWDLPQVPAENRRLSPHADRIIDAIVAYAAKHPNEQLPVAKLSLILPLKRLPEVIGWAESSAGQRQRDFIRVFSTLTHTSFPMIPSGFCGNSSPASIEEAVRRGEDKQRGSPQLMRAWWAEHGQKPYSVWVVDELMRKIELEKDSREWALKEYADDPKMQAFYLREMPHWPARTVGAYAFAPLRQKLAESPDWLQPYILGLIGLCDHPKRLEFVAGFLHNSNDHLKSAAIETLGRLNAREYAKGIRQVLEETADSPLQKRAIDTLSAFADSAALEAIARRLSSDDYRVAGAAESAIRKLLADNIAGVERLARTDQDTEVRRRLSEILAWWHAERAVQAAESSRTTPKVRLQRVEELLRSPESEWRRQGIRLVDRYDLVELIPVCLDLLPDSDHLTRQSLVELITGKGIPELNVANPQKLLGYSLVLDQRIASYCYARFGDDALPLVRKVAFQWRDPARRGDNKAGRPARQLFEILRDAGEPNLDRRMIQLVREVLAEDRSQEYLYLLDILGATAPTDLIDELLEHESQSRRAFAARWIQRRGLKQYADRLTEFAEVQSLDCLPAVEALIEFEHARAWPAVVRLLESNALNSGAHSLGMPGPSAAYHLGMRLPAIRHTHRADMHEMLKTELAGRMRRWVVVALTAGLAHNPETADRDMLLKVAGREDAPRAAQILAAVALSHLGDAECLPELRRLLRDCLRTDCGPSQVACDPGEFHRYRWLDSERARAEVYPQERALLERRYDILGHSYLENSRDQISIVSALRRFADDSMVSEVVEALVSPKGAWNHQAYTLLLQLKGMEGYQLARERAAEIDPEMVDRWTRIPRLFLNVEMSHDEALRLLTYDKLNLLDEAVLILKHDLREAADPLVELFGECRDRHTPYRATILDILCRFGDPRGLDLALDDPLLFMEVADYLAEPPVPVTKVEGFRFNRVQDALTLIDWYRKHRATLIWDRTIDKFRLSHDEGRG